MADDYGAVPDSTQVQMLGAMNIEEGASRLFSAGAPPAVQAQMLQQGANRGAMAAENIRNRYFQTEFKQILETRIKPLQDELQAAADAHEAALAMTVMPVNKVLTAEEARQTVDGVEPTPPPLLQTVPGKPGADGKPTQTTIPTPGQPLPNPALQGPQLNAMASEEHLALVDPVSGQPVPVSSPRGIALMNKATSDFWGANTRINTQVMDILAEYKGNPYAASMATNIMDNAVKQAHMATAGTADPQAAQEWWEGRKKFETDQSAAQQTMETRGIQQQKLRNEVTAGRLGIGQTRAQYDVNTNRAVDLAKTDANVRTALGPLADKPVEQWTEPDKQQANYVMGLFDAQAKQNAAALLKSKVYRIEPAQVPTPEVWQQDMRTRNPAYKQYYAQLVAPIVNKVQGELTSMPQAQRDDIMRANGADDEVIRLADAGKFDDANVKRVMQAYADSTPAARHANDVAFGASLETQEQIQPEMTPYIDRAVQGVIDMMKDAYAKGQIPNPPNEELIRAERYAPAASMILGRTVAFDELKDFSLDSTKARVAAVRGSQLPAEPGQPGILRNEEETPEEEAAPNEEPEQPTGPLAQPLLGTPPAEPAPAPPAPPESKPTESGIQPLSVQYGNEPRLAGPEEPPIEPIDKRVGRLARRAKARMGEIPQAQELPQATAYDMQGNVVDLRTGQPVAVENKNPYVNLPLNVLASLRGAVHDPTTVSLIDEALKIASASRETSGY